MFEQNLIQKQTAPRFTRDLRPLLAAGVDWDFKQGFAFVMDTLLALLPGEPWQGRSRSRIP